MGPRSLLLAGALIIALPARSGWALESAAVGRVRGLLDRARDDYFNGRIEQAIEAVGQAREELAHAHMVPCDLRVRWLLWRTTLYLQSQDIDEAQGAAREAIALDPRARIVLRPEDFPPALIAFVEEQRKLNPPRPVQITVTGYPRGSQVAVDDAPLNENGVVQVANYGHHWIGVVPPLPLVPFDYAFESGPQAREIDLSQAAKAARPPPNRRPLWIALGAGAAAALVGGVIASQVGGGTSTQLVKGSTITSPNHTPSQPW